MQQIVEPYGRCFEETKVLGRPAIPPSIPDCRKS